MLTNHIGDIRIDRIIEQEFPMFDPADFLPDLTKDCLLYTSPSPRDREKSRMPSSA